jgi:hypothetical protein
MTYNEYEKWVLSLPIVKNGMLPWMGRHNVKHFIKYLQEEGFRITAVVSAVSTYKPGTDGEVGFGVMDVGGRCIAKAEEMEFTAHFLSQGSCVEALLAVGEEDYATLDTFRSHAWLESVEIFCSG